MLTAILLALLIILFLSIGGVILYLYLKGTKPSDIKNLKSTKTVSGYNISWDASSGTLPIIYHWTTDNEEGKTQKTSVLVSANSTLFSIYASNLVGESSEAKLNLDESTKPTPPSQPTNIRVSY